MVSGPSQVTVDTQARQALNKLTYKAGVEYDLTPEILTYANISTGFKSGGVNAVPPTLLYVDAAPAAHHPGLNSSLLHMWLPECARWHLIAQRLTAPHLCDDLAKPRLSAGNPGLR